MSNYRLMALIRCSLAIALTFVGATIVKAEECVFDPDDTMGASSLNGSGATACGANAQAQGSGSSAIGADASALDSHATAIGMGSLATRLDGENPINVPDISTTFAALAIGVQSAAAGFDSVAIGRGAIAGTVADLDANDETYALGLADFAIAIGGRSNASEEFAIALGQGALASGMRSVSLGAASAAAGAGSIAIGGDGGDGDVIGANALSANAIALGTDATANSANAVAIGTGALANSAQATALGSLARAMGEESSALGVNTAASGFSSSAVGKNAVASAASATAVGQGAAATGGRATSVGHRAHASGGRSTAVGYASDAGERATAIGETAKAIAYAATAVGFQANSSHIRSTAVGANAATTTDNQIRLGGPDSSVSIGDIDASTAAQSGQLYAVTVDNDGTLGRGSAVASAQQVASLGNSFRQLASFHEAEIAALDGRVATLEGGVSTLFDLTEVDREDTRRGLAAVAAMAQPHFPSEAGMTSYASNVAVHRGEVGFSAGLMHRVSRALAFTAGATYAGGDSATFKAGIAGEF